MPVFIPKGNTPGERRLDSKRFNIQVSISYTLWFIVPMASLFLTAWKTTGSRFGDLSLGFGWMMFGGMIGVLLSDLYVKHKTVGIRRKDILELCLYGFIVPPVAGMILAGVALYVHSL